MTQTIHVTKQPVVLEGYQAVLKPSKFGYSLSAIVGPDLIDALEIDREECLKWAQSKLKNPKRSVQKPEPWEQISSKQFKVKFSWNENTKPAVVDTEGTVVTDTTTPLYSGSRVKLAFKQRPYILKDGTTYGTSLKLAAVQIVTISSAAGIDAGSLNEAEVAELFGKTDGYKIGEPNITPAPAEDIDDDLMGEYDPGEDDF